MNKAVTKEMLLNANIVTAKAMCFHADTDCAEDVLERIGVPCVVKPCSGGSSVGVSIVKTREELEKAINIARKYENDLLIEKYIEGREFSSGILDGKALPPIEIIPREGFFDYKNKYQAGATEEICPANLSFEETEKIKEIALKVHRELKLGSYARIDFIYDGKDFHCLEANTLPGMTPASLLPKEAKAAGISYEELCSKIIELGLKR